MSYIDLCILSCLNKWYILPMNFSYFVNATIDSLLFHRPKQSSNEIISNMGFQFRKKPIFGYF